MRNFKAYEHSIEGSFKGDLLHYFVHVEDSWFEVNIDYENEKATVRNVETNDSIELEIDDFTVERNSFIEFTQKGE